MRDSIKSSLEAIELDLFWIGASISSIGTEDGCRTVGTRGHKIDLQGKQKEVIAAASPTV